MWFTCLMKKRQFAIDSQSQRSEPVLPIVSPQSARNGFECFGSSIVTQHRSELAVNLLYF